MAHDVFTFVISQNNYMAICQNHVCILFKRLRLTSLRAHFLWSKLLLANDLYNTFLKEKNVSIFWQDQRYFEINDIIDKLLILP